nr:hypothetical protein [Armatimonas sp.]
MPVDAILYVQVPKTTTPHDWQRWRDGFLERFPRFTDLGQDILVPDWNVMDEPVVQTENGWEVIWEVFPRSVFLQMYYGMGAYYGPGYERGYLPNYIEYAQWLEINIPESCVWYGNDSGSAASIFNNFARALLLSYFHSVGYQPYDAKKEDKKSWEPAQAECWRLWMVEQERVLREVREHDGLQ